MEKRTYTAGFKAKIVLEILRGERELNEIAAENEIAPNQLRNWKAEFLDNAIKRSKTSLRKKSAKPTSSPKRSVS